MSSQSVTWHVLGAGSLGTLWATRLARAGSPVRLLLREARLAEYRASGGLTLIEDGIASQVPLIAESGSRAGAPIRRLLLACKAYDAGEAAQALAARLAPEAEVLLLQNGVGSAEEVQAALPRVNCVRIVSTEGAYRDAPWRYVFAGRGENWLGSLPDAPPPAWLKELQLAGIPAAWCSDIERRQWRKLALNCAINPLTVLLDCRNGVLREYPQALRPLLAELRALLAARFDASAANDLEERVFQVLEGTAQNYSSMHQDVTAGRRTEIAYLLDRALAEADRLALRAPALRTLQRRLRQHLAALGLPGV